MKYLIINADDFGFSPQINKGICDAYLRGVVTDTTILIHSPYAEEAIAMASEISLPVGIHIDFVTDFARNHDLNKQDAIGPDGQLARELFMREYHKKINHLYSCEELIIFRNEIRNQILKFIDLTGEKPSHLDYHFGLHYLPDVMAIYLTVAEEYEIPVRWGKQYAGVNPYRYAPKVFCDEFHAENATFNGILKIIDKPWVGVMEICCHPGYVTPNELPDLYNSEREIELAVLTNPELKAEFSKRGISLVNYNWLNERLRSRNWDNTITWSHTEG